MGPLGPLSNTVDSPNYVSSQKNRDTVSTVSQHSRGPSSNGDQIFFKAVTYPKFGRIPKLKGSAEELRSNRHVPVSAKMNQRTKILELLRRIEEFKPIIQNIVDTSTKEKRGAPELAADTDIDEIGDLNDEGWKELKSLKEESEIVNYFKKRFNNRLSSNPLINLSWYGSNSSIKNNNLSEKNVDAFENKFNVDNENSNGDVTLPDFEIKTSTFFWRSTTTVQLVTRRPLNSWQSTSDIWKLDLRRIEASLATSFQRDCRMKMSIWHFKLRITFLPTKRFMLELITLIVKAVVLNTDSE